MKKRFDIVGKPRRRVDGRAKVTGQLRYADDLSLPRMLFAKLLRSPHPHAHIRGIATAHFTVRRLERRHGPVLVRAAYEALRAPAAAPA